MNIDISSLCANTTTCQRWTYQTATNLTEHQSKMPAANFFILPAIMVPDDELILFLMMMMVWRFHRSRVLVRVQIIYNSHSLNIVRSSRLPSTFYILHGKFASGRIWASGLNLPNLRSLVGSNAPQSIRMMITLCRCRRVGCHCFWLPQGIFYIQRRDAWRLRSLVSNDHRTDQRKS